MYSVLGNHKTMTHRYTVNVIHIYRGIIVFTQHIIFYDKSNILPQSVVFPTNYSNVNCSILQHNIVVYYKNNVLLQNVIFYYRVW